MPEHFQIKSPVNGVNRVVQREGQPPDTCWDALNVLPFDRYGRRRVAQRHGLVKQYSTQIATSKVQGMLPVNNVTYSATSSGNVAIPVSTFSAVGTGASTATNNILWATANGANDPGVVVGSTIVKGSTLQFNLEFTFSSTVNSAHDLYLSFSQGSTSFGNVAAGNDPIDCLWQYNPALSTIHVEVGVNNSTGFAITTGDSTGVLTSGAAIPCQLIWAANGDLSAKFGVLTTSSGTANYNSTASTMQFWAEGDSSTLVAASTINFVSGGTVSTGTFGYSTLLIAVAGGFLWVGDSSGNISKPTLGQSTAQINSTNYVSMCVIQGVVYIVDGSSTVHTYNIATSTLGTLTASKGTGVGGGSTSLYFLCCNWRGRLVLAGDAGNPQNYYMSRAGDPTDWDYSQTDSAAAFAGNLSKAGLIGEPILALIPFSDDYLKIGCSHSLWMIQGDPADGGSIVNVSQNIGVVGKDAWIVDPAGTLWFVATGGLYSVRPAWEFYRPPEPVSLFNVDTNFTQLDPGVARTTLVFDPDLHYLHVFMSAPAISGTLGQHLTMDFRSVGQEGPPSFWPQQFPSTMGPTAACTFFGDGNPNNRTVLIGGNDGYIRAWTQPALDDDGTVISAGITVGPFALSPGQAATVTGVTLDLGETPVTVSSTHWGVIAKMFAGADAYSVTEYVTNAGRQKPVSVINMTLDRRQKTFRQRLRGGWFALSLASLTSSTVFSFESAVIDFLPSGPNRERRQ